MLQQQGALRPDLPLPWATTRFLGVVQAAIYDDTSGSVARRDGKPLAGTLSGKAVAWLLGQLLPLCCQRRPPEPPGIYQAKWAPAGRGVSPVFSVLLWLLQ